MLLKRDFELRSKEISALEQNASAEDWIESYKKLKIKVIGEKLPDQAKQKQQAAAEYTNSPMKN